MIIFKSLQTTSPGLYDITTDILEAAAQSGIAEGICLVCCLDATTGTVVASRDDPLILEDIMEDFTRVFPPRLNYPGGDAYMGAAHSIAALSGGPIDLAITGGQVLLGASQGVFLLDANGGQEVRYTVTCI